MALVLTQAPATEPLTLAEAKLHMRVEVADDDALITSLITAARQWCEAFQGRAYITQTWQLWLDKWPKGDAISIPRPPLQSVTSIKYYGADGAEYVMPAADYLVDTKSEPGRIVLGYGKTWPSVTLRPAGAIAIEFVAGYGNADAVPQRVKQAILLLVASWYQNREAVITGTVSKEVEFALTALLWQERVVPV